MKCDRYIGTGSVNANKNGEPKYTSSVSRHVASISNGRSTHLGSRFVFDTNASNINDATEKNASVPAFTNVHMDVSGSPVLTQPRITSKDEVLGTGNSSSSKDRGSGENSTRCIVIEMKQSDTNKSEKAKCGILSKHSNDKTSIREYKVTLMFHND